jgi:hypothetical protein
MLKSKIVAPTETSSAVATAGTGCDRSRLRPVRRFRIVATNQFDVSGVMT